jgi:endonuclease G
MPKLKKRTVKGALAGAALLAVAFAGLRALPARSVRGLPAEDRAKSSVSSTANQPSATVVYAGNPKRTSYPNNLVILTSIGYVLGYDETRKDAAWVAYHIFRVDDPNAYPRPAKFRVDRRTTAKVKHEDYTNMPYDRGHMAPNYAIGMRYGKEAQRETFLMSNVVPQKPELNEQIWERLEATEAKTYANEFGDLWVITGPIFMGAVRKLPCGVQIPDACHKILISEHNHMPRVLAFIIPQTVKGKEPLKMFLTSVDEIEKETGLDFLAGLDDKTETRIEAEVASDMW